MIMHTGEEYKNPNNKNLNLYFPIKCFHFIIIFPLLPSSNACDGASNLFDSLPSPTTDQDVYLKITWACCTG